MNKQIIVIGLLMMLSASANAAWWNSTYSYRYPIIKSTTYTYAYAINDTHGINGDIIWARIGNKSYLYSTQSGCLGSIAIANETDEKYWENESDRQGNEPTRVWNDARAVWHFGENTGDTTYDSSGNGNNGTCYGAGGGNCNWTTGKFGYGIQLDGSNDYVNCGNDASLRFTGAMTIEAWVRSTDNEGDIVARYGSAPNDKVYILGIWATNAAWRFMIGSTNAHAVAGNCSDGNWHHVVGVYSPSQWVKIYVDGVLKDTDNTDIPSAQRTGNTNVRIGARSYKPQYLKGTIDEVRIYNRTLSEQEIMEHYQNGVNNRITLGAEGTQNSAPTTPSPTISPSSVYTNTPKISCSDQIIDPDGDNMDVTIMIYNGSTVLNNCTWSNKASGTTLTCNATDNTMWVKNNVINCTVTATDNNSQSSVGSTTKAVSNLAPDQPTLNSPADNSTGVSTSPTLTVTVSDTDGDSMDVTFYDASDNSAICSNTSVSSGSSVSCEWMNLSLGTTYEWFVNVTDGADTTTSPTWNFSTNQAPTTPTPTITPSTIKTNNDANCTASYVDPDGDNGRLLFMWYVNGLNVFNKSFPGLSNNVQRSSILDSGNYTKNNVINCTVIATDNNSQSTNSTKGTVVQNTQPTINTAPGTITKNANGTSWSYKYNAIDPDFDDGIDNLIWTANTTLIDINTSTGVISDTPDNESEAGTYSILINVSDGTACDTDTLVYKIMDVTKPRVTINSPTTTTYIVNQVALNTTIIDPNIDTCWYSMNNFTNITPYNCRYVVISNISDGSNTIRVAANDTYGNVNNTESVTFIIDTKGPNITLTNPTNNANITANSQVNFTCSFADLSNLDTALFYWDYAGNWTLNGTANLSNTTDTAVFLRDLTVLGNYSWNCWANDSHGYGSWESSNYTFFVVTTTTTTTLPTTTTIRRSGGGGGGGGGGGYIPQPRESCFDGLRNCHDGACEEGIDCGGPCKPCPSCSDGIQNQGEKGIDCGGPCKPCPTTTAAITTTTITTTKKPATTTTITKPEVTSTTIAATTTTAGETTSTVSPRGAVPLEITSVAIVIVLLFALFLILMNKYR